MVLNENDQFELIILSWSFSTNEFFCTIKWFVIGKMLWERTPYFIEWSNFFGMKRMNRCKQLHPSFKSQTIPNRNCLTCTCAFNTWIIILKRNSIYPIIRINSISNCWISCAFNFTVNHFMHNKNFIYIQKVAEFPGWN